MIDFKTEKFSGPLSLLLSLIESEEMDITEINLAKISDQYIERLKNAVIDPEEIADFLVIAAKLLLIKSKALLPYLASAEDEEEIDDFRRQLRMYQEFIKASEKIAEIMAARHFLYAPDASRFKKRLAIASFLPPKSASAEVLHDALLKMLDRLKVPVKKLPEATVEAKISIDDIISSIRFALKEKFKINFSHLMANSKSKTEIIVSFLAILELAKQRELNFEQEELFSDIHLSVIN